MIVRSLLSLLTCPLRLRTPISSAQGMIRAWVARFDVSYLEEQTYFYPFPEDLITLRDSGKAV